MLVMREYRIGDEPIPNYRLLRFLGRGGFGEVWQAKAPGGIEVAMKFIRLDKKAGKKEFESLRVVKRIKHPHLMAINAFWLKDADGNVLDDDSVDLLGMNLLAERGGRKAATETALFAQSQAAELVIALELCDKNLLDRLRECQSAGLQGIPPDELLDYMDGCAKAIDYLNSPVHVLEDGEKKAVQHCDIKPQNIMLLSGEPKVCDFGLVRAQSDVRKTAIAASLAYAPPEILIKGQQSEATDQYSLAVSYYELRTGELPFADEAANHFAIMKAHEQGTLDFSRLPDGERAVIERATMLNPAARFARTADMVAALRRAQRGESDILPVSSAADRLQSGQELVPGYVLKDYLFRPDGRTEVWDATGANGDEHALWIYDLTSYRGEIDIGALRRLRAGSHPQIASVFGFWLLDAERRVMEADRAGGAAPPRTLVIASERTRDNLVFLVDECRRRSGDGLPAERLLGCLKQVALALDALNSGDAGCGPIAHCDVRPANLLVFGETTKLGNFAWCRGLGGGNAELPEPSRRSEWRTTAPEVVHGRPSPRSDQYSLADSYVQMRTGQLLGDSLSSSSQSSGRLSGRLDLTVLRPDEQQVVRRALSEVPAERFTSCIAFVEQLMLVVQPVSAFATADDGRVQTLEPGDLSSPAKSWKDTRPIKKTPTAPISVPKPARRGVRRVAFVTMLLGGMVVGAVLMGRMYIEQSVDRALVDREMETALAVLKQFERLPLLIAPDLPGRVVRRADERVADDWHRAQKVYDGLVSGWPAEAGLQELKDKLIAAGVNEFHDLIEKDPEAAEKLRVSLAESFGDDGRIRRLPKIEPWENKVRGLLASARKKLGERLTASAQNDCEAAGALLKSHPGAQADLRHDLLLLRVAVCVQQLKWQQAEQLLADAADESLGRAPPRLLARLAALQAIVGTHYTGGKLDPSRTDETLNSAAAELATLEQIAPGWWDESNDEYEARLAKMLVDELVLRAVDFVFSGGEGRRKVGETLLTVLSRLRAVSDQVPVRMAKSLLLLCRPGQAATPDEIGADMGSWVDSKKLPTASREFAFRVREIAGAVAQWGLRAGSIETAEEHLQHLSAGSGVSVANELLLLGEKSLRALVDESPPNWRKIKAKCGELGYLANTSKQAEAAFVLAARAECIIELSADENRATDVAQALEIIASLTKRVERTEGDASRPYFDYVELLARDAADSLGQEDEWLPLADSLSLGLQSAVPGPLAVSDRASRGRALLGRLAVKLLGLDADETLNGLQPLDIDAAQAERVFSWLGTSGRPPAAAETDSVEFALAVAALNKQPAEAGIAAEMLDALTASGRKDRQILLLKAASSKGMEAIDWYAKVLQESRSGDDDPLLVYQRVVQPAIDILDALPDEQKASIGKAAASIYADQGRLIRSSLLVENEVVAQAQTKAAEVIFNAYDQAATLDPNEADYFIERGTARYEWRSSDLDGLLSDIQRAETLLMERQPPALFGLKGANSILRARSQPLTAPQDRINLYKQAIASYETAVTLSDQREARFLILLSAANVELANATTEPDAELLKYLEAAKTKAEAATKLPAAHPEDAWLALGNAIEDYGLLPRQTDRVRYDWYAKAIKTFDQAEVIAQQNNLPNALLLISRGRVRYRMATCGWQPQQAPAELGRALDDLRSAMEQIQIEDAELAEADLWQSRVQSELSQLASAKAAAAQNSAAAASNQATRAEQQRRMEAETQLAAAAHAAGIEAMRAAMGKISVEDVNWPIYQGYWLQLATTRAEQAERATALLKWPRIADAPETRATAIDALAAASESPAAGLKVYRRELRIGKDLSQVSERDGWGLVYLCNFIALRAELWTKHEALCKDAGQLALKLAEKGRNPELEASACAALAFHEAQRASRANATNQEKSTALESARVYLKRALLFADNLPTASLLSIDRQRLERERCWDWRMSLAILGAKYSNARWLSDDLARALWEDALSATETGYQPTPTVAKFALKRRELLTIGAARGFKRKKGK